MIDLNKKIKKIFEMVDKVPLEYVFVFLALVYGITFVFIVPFSQTPDEVNHYKMIINDEFGTGYYQEELYNESGLAGVMEIESVYRNPSAKLSNSNIVEAEKLYFSHKLSWKDFSFSVKILRHLPAGIGFYTGVVLGCNMLMCTYLAKIFSMVFYIITGFFIIRILPIKKNIFMFFLLLPMYVQQCTSVNYDAVMLPCFTLLFAYYLKLFYSNESIRYKQLSFICILVFVIAITKPPYALIAFLFFTIPRDRYVISDLKLFDYIYKYRFLIIILFIILFLIGGYIFRNNVDVRELYIAISSPVQFFKVLINTIKTRKDFYEWTLIGGFGLMEFGVSWQYIIYTCMILVYINCYDNTREKYSIKTKNRLLFILVSVFMILLIYVAMMRYSFYENGLSDSLALQDMKSNLYNITAFTGVQGRYFLPPFIVLLISLSGNGNSEHKYYYKIIQIIFYVCSYVYVYGLLLDRFWV